MKYFLMTFLIIASTFNTAIADIQVDSKLIRQSTSYSRILDETAKNYDNIAIDLYSNSHLLKAGTTSLKLIFVAEAIYVSWFLGGRLVVCKTCVTGLESHATALFGGMARIALSSGVGAYAYRNLPSAFNEDHEVLSETQQSKFDRIRDELKKSERVDLNLRSAKPERLLLFKQLSSHDKEEYLHNIQRQLQDLPKAHQAMQLNFNKYMDSILNQYDPANHSYFSRIFKLGEDQILYGDIVISGAQARRDISLAFMTLNDDLRNEYKAILKNIN